MSAQTTYFGYSRTKKAYYVGGKGKNIEYTDNIEGAELFSNSTETSVKKYLESVASDDAWYVEKVRFNHPMGAGFLRGLEV